MAEQWRIPSLPPCNKTLVMGIVNVTPDSFYDGGRWAAPEAAIAHARQLRTDGADILDSWKNGTWRPDMVRKETV